MLASIQSLARTSPLTPALPTPSGLSAVTDPRKVVSCCPAGHLLRWEAGWEEMYTKVVIPVPFQVTMPVPDPVSRPPGRVPEPPVVGSSEHELIVIKPERLPLTTVQMTGTFCGPRLVVPGVFLEAGTTPLGTLLEVEPG
jgi:hypothetical protein